ncbi:MAG: reprolysin-like metallopeptidase [Chitinophagaceae bacterium]
MRQILKQCFAVALIAGTVSVAANAQKGIQPWNQVGNEKSGTSVTQGLLKKPEIFGVFELDTLAIKRVLFSAPMENLQDPSRFNRLPRIQIPLGDGTFQEFAVEHVPTLAPELEARFPLMRNFAGVATDGSGALARFSWGYLGFYGYVFNNGEKGDIRIDPAYANNKTTYIAFAKRNAKMIGNYVEGEIVGMTEKMRADMIGSMPTANRSTGNTLRTYRTAIAANAEYSNFFTAVQDVAVVQSAINASANRVSGIYEKEVGVRLQLIANNTSIIFFDTNTDGYTNSNGATMLGQNQTTLDNIIGNGNYDLGHVFSTGGGGIASLGSICVSTRKAQGVTGSSSPVGDPFDVDYVAHEMGHQLGCGHTFNAATGSCAGNGSTSTNAEPGSGSTIMAYAGICGVTNDLQNNSNPYFHFVSFEQARVFLTTGSGASCGNLTNVTNTIPTVDAGLDYTIPIATPFVLTGTGSDPDAGANLTYCWEQSNVGGTFSNWNAPTGVNAPLFRSFSPVASNSRTFPRMQNVVSGTTTIGELLPGINRTMRFALTVRDNQPVGGVNNDEMVVTVAGSTPFSVVAPNTSVSWTAGSFQTIRWDVAATNIAPFNVSNVAIELSTDGGFNYPFVLAASTANDGVEEVRIPTTISSTARVRVRALGNIFFDISDVNFSIVASTQSTFAFNNPEVRRLCSPWPSSTTVVLRTSSLGGFNNPITLSVSNLPQGVTASFSVNPVTPGDSTVITLNGIGGLPVGPYNVTITGSASGTTNVVRTIGIDRGDLLGNVTIVSPTQSTNGLSLTPTFRWRTLNGATSYTVQISTTNFSTPYVTTITTTDTFAVSNVTLNPNTVYYYRVIANSTACGGTTLASNVIGFGTAPIGCASDETTPFAAINDLATITSNIFVANAGNASDVNVTVNMTHTYMGDLVLSIANPGGTSVNLKDFSGTCSRNGTVTVTYNDSAASLIACPALGTSSTKPSGSLATLNGSEVNGLWTLTVTDAGQGDVGTLNSWSISYCRNVQFALPVAWLSFTAKASGANSAALQWEVANEVNVASYEVQVATDGINYKSLGVVVPRNRANTIATYNFVHNNVNAPVVYYRIKQLDADGKFSYSKVARVNFGKSTELQVLPNPASNYVFVQNTVNMQALQLFAIDGKLVWKQQNVKAQNATIPVAGLTNGVYQLQVIDVNGKVENVKVIVQH